MDLEASLPLLERKRIQYGVPKASTHFRLLPA